MTWSCQAILFDLDGTLVDSLAAVDRAWSRWAIRQGLDPAVVVPQIHGRRAQDSIQMLCPHVDIAAEAAWLEQTEATDTEGIVPIAGAHDFVNSIPEGRWAIVTSGARAVGTARLRAGHFSPSHAIFAEDVTHGKPAPDPYLTAARRLGIDPEQCIVFEDAIAGLKSGKAAGMRVIAISPSPNRPDLDGADLILPDYLGISVKPHIDGLNVEFDFRR